MILLLSIWGGRRSGLTTDFDKEMMDVKKCMDVLALAEVRCVYSLSCIPSSHVLDNFCVDGTSLAVSGTYSFSRLYTRLMTEPSK